MKLAHLIFTNRPKETRLSGRAGRSQRAFTMVEIAMAIGVIGFALVAIIGILPKGMSVQKDNREETIINQDGPYFLNAIARGTKGLDFLTNHVDWVAVTNYAFDTASRQWNPIPPPYITIFTNDPLHYIPAKTIGNAIIDGSMTNGAQVVKALTTPRFDPGAPNFLHDVTARVRALSGSALEQGGANSQVAFTYLLRPELVPMQVAADTGSPAVPIWADEQTNYLICSTNLATSNHWEYVTRLARFQQTQFLPKNSYELRLRFNWPLLPNGATGPNRQIIRSRISGCIITNGPDKGLFQPQGYSTIAITNSIALP